MIPMAPGFFRPRSAVSGYWPYIRDVLIPDGRAVAHFDLGNTNGDNNSFELRYQEYPPDNGTAAPSVPSNQPLPYVDYIPGTTNVAKSSSGGAISTRGYIESTSSTDNNSPVAVWWPEYTSNLVPENFWFALAYRPTNPQVANGGIHSIVTWAEYFASTANAFPFRLYHNSGATKVILALDGGGDFLTDVELTSTNDLVVGEWNHIIVRVAKVADGGGAALWLNGTKVSGTRSSAFSVAGSNAFRFMLLSAYGLAGGFGKHRALGRVSELTISNTSTSSGASNLITDQQALDLYNAFLTDPSRSP